MLEKGNINEGLGMDRGVSCGCVRGRVERNGVVVVVRRRRRDIVWRSSCSGIDLLESGDRHL